MGIWQANHKAKMQGKPGTSGGILYLLNGISAFQLVALLATLLAEPFMIYDIVDAHKYVLAVKHPVTKDRPRPRAAHALTF
jgi:hypothetical protein